MCFNVALLLKAKDCDRVFVSNDPVNFVDPWGLTASCPQEKDGMTGNPNFRKYSTGEDDPRRLGEKIFHCGFECYIEKQSKSRSPSEADPLAECCYDECGELVDGNHEYSGCRGTADTFNPDRWFWHAVADPGGIVRAGVPALIDSLRHRSNNSPAPRGDELVP